MTKKFKRAVCVVAVAAVVGTLPAMAGCTSSKPEAKITIDFNGTEYVLEYKMSRNLYPQTVQHFIELADNNFYDNTIIHNYASSYWYGGAYAYNAEEYAADFEVKAMDDYLYANSLEKGYYDLFNAGKLTPSVYKDYLDGTYVGPLATVIGEFTNNSHVIDNGTGLKSQYGALRMYYTSKATDIFKDGKNPHVSLDKVNNVEGLGGDYSYNSATSLFSIQVGTSTSSDSTHCIFGVLTNTDELGNLQDAIKAYKDDSSSTYNSTKFTSTYTDIFVDRYDEYIPPLSNTESYILTGVPLIVKSVKITKY